MPASSETRPGALIACLLLLTALARPVSARACELSAPDREWIGSAIETWARAADALEQRIDTMPWTILYDDHCVVHLNPRTGAGAGAPHRSASPSDDRAGAGADPALAVTFGGRPVPTRAVRYRTRFAIPNGAKLSSTAVAFTSLAKDADPFFVMALPSVWKKDRRSKPGEDVEEFTRGVLAHEMTHTIHLRSIAAAIEALQSRQSIPGSLDDDYLQKVFAEDAEYVSAYEREIALYQAALRATDDGAARDSVRQALAASDQRRDRFFVGANAYFREVEPLFLNMEGVASWVAYRVVGHDRDPIAFSGRFWSQQEGLLLFLLLDRFDPHWKARVFDRQVPDPFAMLRRAVGPAGS